MIALRLAFRISKYHQEDDDYHHVADPIDLAEIDRCRRQQQDEGECGQAAGQRATQPGAADVAAAVRADGALPAE